MNNITSSQNGKKIPKTKTFFWKIKIKFFKYNKVFELKKKIEYNLTYFIKIWDNILKSTSYEIKTLIKCNGKRSL